MSIRFAKIISVLFHPLLTPTYALLMLINIQSHSLLLLPISHKYLVVGFVFLTTFVLPSIIIVILLKFGKIKSLEMDSQHERILPMIIIAALFYGTYQLLKQTPVTGIMTFFMVGATMLVLLALMINYITKISLHMTAWGGVLGCFLGMAIAFNFEFSLLIYLLIFLIGIIAAARLRLNAHTPLQVYGGFLLGAGGMLLLFFLI